MVEPRFLIKHVLLPLCAATLILSSILPSAAADSAPRPVAIFDFELDDTSLPGQMQGQNKADLDRLRALRGALADMLAKSGRYAPVALNAAVEKQANDSNLLNCGGCELTLAKQVGAQIAVVGWVQKVSVLILNINVQMRDIATGQLVAAGSVDIRGDTDESWSRGLKYLVQNRLLIDQPQ